MSKLKKIVYNLIILFLVFLLLFIFFIGLLTCLKKFIPIDDLLIVLLPFGLSLSLSIIHLIAIRLSSRKIYQSQLSFWLKNNSQKIFLAFLVIIILLFSITNKPLWDNNEIRDVLSTEWTIFGLSISIFLVWDVIYTGYIKKKQPKIETDMDSVQKLETLYQKQAVFKELESARSSIIILSINLVLLLLSSGLVHVIHMPDNIITQNIVVCAFYFSTNTIIMLFLDILKPILEENKALKKDNLVIKEEFETIEIKVYIQSLKERVIKIIDDSNTNEREKEKAEAIIKEIDRIDKQLDKDINLLEKIKRYTKL